MLIITFILIVFTHLSFQQDVNITILEIGLQRATNLMISAQNKVLKTFLNCKASAAVASSNLKISSFSKDLTDSLDNVANFSLQLMTFKDFYGMSNCQYLSVCECISFKIVLIDTQIKKIDEVIESIISNSSTFYELFSSLTWKYSLTYNSIQTIWTKEVAVLKTCNQSRLVIGDLFDLNVLANTVKKYFIEVKSYLVSQHTSCPVVNSTFADEGIKIDQSLKACESQLKNLTAIALAKVTISLNTVASTKKVQAGIIDSKRALRELFASLNEQETCDDYDWPTVSWPRIPDTSGATGSYLKVRTCQAKKESFSYTKSRASRNQTRLSSNLDDFKSSTLSSKKKRSIKVGSASTDQDTITATTNVIKYYDVYIQELQNAIVKVDNWTKFMEPNMIFTSFPPPQSCSVPTLENLGTLSPLNVSACNVVLDVFDYSGCYRKTICKMTGGGNSNQAATKCLQIGGNSFGVLSIHDYTALSYLASQIYAPTGLYNMHIGGRQLANGSWYHGTKPIYQVPYFPPLSTTYILPNICLQASKSNNSFFYKPIQCDNVPGDQFCELLKPVTPLPLKQIGVPFNSMSLTVCNKTSPMIGSSGYMKTACLTQFRAERLPVQGLCQGNGMRLYSITNADEFNELKNFMISVYGASDTQIHVGGERQSNGSWLIVDQPDPVPIFPPLAPTATNSCAVFRPSMSKLDSADYLSVQLGFCEFVKPSLPPNLNILPTGCLFPADLFHPNGSYYKTACKANGSMNFPTYDSWCRKQNMYPFAINSAADVSYAIAYGRSVYGIGSHSIVYVGGVSDQNGNWFTYTPNKKPLFAGLTPLATGVNVCFGYDGAGTSAFYFNDGSGVHDGFCEFNRLA